MYVVHRFFSFLFLLAALSSCEVKCNVGEVSAENKTEQKENGKPVIKEGAILYNDIELETNKISVNKAYLVFKNGDRVPDGNFVDFKSPVKLILVIDRGWVTLNGKAKLGASEKVETDDKKVILDEEDLFIKYTDGISPEDAKIIGLTVALQLKENSPPATFIVKFRVWDKNGGGYVAGSYKLYSK
jgi:hypothetical protein